MVSNKPNIAEYFSEIPSIYLHHKNKNFNTILTFRAKKFPISND